VVVNVERGRLVEELPVFEVEWTVAGKLTGIERDDEIGSSLRHVRHGIRSTGKKREIRCRNGISACHHAVLPQRSQRVREAERGTERIRVGMFVCQDKDASRIRDQLPAA
jgi:hypothetical protein